MALDVLENEKLFALNASRTVDFKAIDRKYNKIILTPHIAGWTNESKEKIATVTLQKMDAFKLF
jgi:D-3-phosphoglycerate dehydrogenase